MATFMRVSWKLVFHQSTVNALAPLSTYSILPQCIYPRLLSCICFSLYCDACLKSSVLRVGVKMLHNTHIPILCCTTTDLGIFGAVLRIFGVAFVKALSDYYLVVKMHVQTIWTNASMYFEQSFYCWNIHPWISDIFLTKSRGFKQCGT